MKEEISNIIKIIGIGLNEIVIEFNLEWITFNSIELIDDKIYLHSFDNDFDIMYDFDDLNDEDQKIIYKILSNIIYN